VTVVDEGGTFWGRVSPWVILCAFELGAIFPLRESLVYPCVFLFIFGAAIG
jgi:hypothetical protein